MSLSEIRRLNLQRVALELGGQARLVEKCKKSGPYVSQVLNGVKSLGEAATRKFERSLGLPLGTLDTAPVGDAPPSVDLGSLSATNQALVRQLVSVLHPQVQDLTSKEQRLLVAYRSSSAKGKSVIIAVADAQASLATDADRTVSGRTDG